MSPVIDVHTHMLNNEWLKLLEKHGRPRYTGDIDFWINPQAQNIQSLLKALDRFGFGSLGLSN